MSGRIQATVRRDLHRVLIPWAIGFAFVLFSGRFAQLVGEPAFAPWGLFAGAAFFTVALSHVLRRMLFHRIDLQYAAVLAGKAPVGAGLVFLGVCVVLAAFVLMTGAMLRS